MVSTAVLHYPRLDTVLMVEDKIKKSRKEFTRTQLWKALPKQMQYQTFQVILDYFVKSNKIIYVDDLIVWIGSNPKLDALVRESRVL